MSDPIQLYLDEDAMRASLVRALRARQIDVLTALEAGLVARPDDEHLAFATVQNRVLFSFNRGDFAHLHKLYLTEGRHHTGIIISDQLGTGQVVRRLMKLLAARSATDMLDWLEYLSNWR